MGFVYMKVKMFDPDVRREQMFQGVIDGYPCNKWEGLPLPDWALAHWPLWVYMRNTIYGAIAEKSKFLFGAEVSNSVKNVSQ